MVLFWCGVVSMSSGWGLMKRKQGDQCRCCCWPAAQLALQTPSHFAAVPSPSPKSLFQCWELPRGVQKNYPTEPNSPSIGFCPSEREREEGEARGLVTCLVGLTEIKKKKYIIAAKWFHTVHICTDRRVISGKNNTLQPNLSPHFHLLWVCLWSWSDAVNKWATL